MKTIEIIEKIIKERDREEKEMRECFATYHSVKNVHYRRHLHAWKVLDDLLEDIGNNIK